MIRLPLPYLSPPLHANTRYSRQQEARIIRQVREDVGWLAKCYKLGTGHPHITVGLEWRPKVRRRRDGNENLAPLVKACVDGLVGVGVVRDDTPDIVTRARPVLHDPDRESPGLWLVVDVG